MRSMKRLKTDTDKRGKTNREIKETGGENICESDPRSLAFGNDNEELKGAKIRELIYGYLRDGYRFTGNADGR